MRREGETDREEQTAREDLMWSCDVLDYIDDGQLCHFLELVSKSSVVYGSSNNLELGLHLLHYFRGNVKLAIKALLDNSIELPVNHPISTYKYNGRLERIPRSLIIRNIFYLIFECRNRRLDISRDTEIRTSGIQT